MPCNDTLSELFNQHIGRYVDNSSILDETTYAKSQII